MAQSGRLGRGAVFLLAFLALLDGLIGQFREPANLIKLLPGLTAEIDGPLEEEVPGVQELTYFSDSDLLTLSFATVHKGYFLGGNLWRGQITANPRLRPGEYHLTVASRKSISPVATLAFRIMVFSDPLSLQRSSKSLIRRHIGRSPWGAAAACLPGDLLAFGSVFYLSQARSGYWPKEAGLRFTGSLERTEFLRFTSAWGRSTGSTRACSSRFIIRGKGRGPRPGGERPRPTDAVALVTVDQEIRPGFLISKV